MGNQTGFCVDRDTFADATCEQQDKVLQSWQSFPFADAECLVGAGPAKDAVSPFRPAISLNRTVAGKAVPFRDPVIQNLDSAFARCDTLDLDPKNFGRMVTMLGLDDVQGTDAVSSSSRFMVGAEAEYLGDGGSERHGFGVLSWQDGRRYEGQFVHGVLEGTATMSWPDGRTYVGQYRNNKKHGHGSFVWADGRQYVGQWDAGLRHGRGVYTNAKREKRLGEWAKDKPVSWDLGDDRKGAERGAVPLEAASGLQVAKAGGA